MIGVMAFQNERCKVRPIGRTQRKAERASVLIRHTRQRVRRLNAVTSRVHSALTLAMPRSLNCCASSRFLMIAKRGSTSGSRRTYICLASSVAIHSLCRRSATLCSPISTLRPYLPFFVRFRMRDTLDRLPRKPLDKCGSSSGRSLFP